MTEIIALLILMTSLVFSQENLLSNPSFDGVSDDWYPATPADSVPEGFVEEWCSDCGVDGSGGLHIYLPFSIRQFLGFTGLASSVESGECYYFAADVKYDNSANTPTVTIAFLDDTFGFIGNGDNFPLLGSSDWRRIEGYGTAPEGTEYLAFIFGSETKGEFWIDNCFVGIADTSYREITIYFSSNDGMIKNLSGTNRSPINPGYPFDLSSGFARLEIPIVRTHDWYGPGDRHQIFPDWEADPDDSLNYNFAPTDSFVASIINTGAEVFFRLGESWEDDPIYNVPPPDNATWAKVCKNIVRHYNEGWANGFFYNIRYWEIWNEPDIDWFWSGTYEQYYDMYIAVAETLKSYDPSLLVGAPAMASVENEDFIDGMLTAVSSADAPLDFFSWHRYDDGSAYNYVLINRYLRQKLNEHNRSIV